MHRLLLSTALMTFAMTASAQTSTNGAQIARAKSFELDMPYVPPPGDPMAHHAAGYAKVMGASRYRAMPITWREPAARRR